MFELFRNRDYEKRVKETLDENQEIQKLKASIQKLIDQKYSAKLKLYIIDTGSCNACELEIQALFNPLYNISSIGIEISYDIREANFILITGLLTENMCKELDRYNILFQENSKVLTVGDCPLLNLPFHQNFALKEERKIFSTFLNIKGCPPNPKKILEGILNLIQEV